MTSWVIHSGAQNTTMIYHMSSHFCQYSDAPFSVDVKTRNSIIPGFINPSDAATKALALQLHQHIHDFLDC
jgi:hypothetical protein